MKRFTPIPISNEFDMPAIRIIEDKEGRYVRYKDAIAEIEALRAKLADREAAIVVAPKRKKINEFFNGPENYITDAPEQEPAP